MGNTTAPFIAQGDFKTGLCKPFKWKPDPNAFQQEDLEYIAKLFAKQVSFFAVYPVQPSATRFAEALKQYAKPEGKYYLVADNQCYSCLKFRKARNHLKAEMDRGRIKKAEVKGVVIFTCGNSLPDWIIDMFKLTLNFRKKLYITPKITNTTSKKRKI